MIVSYEVGAVFRLMDEASPAVRALTERLEVMNRVVSQVKTGLAELSEVRFAGLSRSMGTLDRAMVGVGGAADRMGTQVAGALGAAETRLLAVTQQAHALTAALQQAAAAGQGIPRLPRGGGGGGLPGAGGGGGGIRRGHAGGGGGGIGGHVRPLQGSFPGGHASIRGGNAFLAGAGLVGYGIYEEGEIEDIVARALLTGQVAIGPNMTQMGAFTQLRDIIQKASSQGGFDPKEVGEAILTTERQFGGLSFDKRMDVLKTLLPAAMTEARMKEARLPEAFEALVGLAHMTGTFDADKLPGIVKGFTYASTITPVPIGQFQKALSYSMPILHAGLGMDPDAIMFLTAMTQTAGVTNTKSGTWIRSFFERLMPQEGGLHVRSKGARAHNQALTEMGLLADGHPTWEVKGTDGKVDWMASTIQLAVKLQAALAKMPDDVRLGRLQRAFGERGGGFGALMNLPQFVDQLPVIAGKMKTFQGGDDFLTELTRVSPAQQARNALADLKNVLMDIGQVALPPVVSALRDIDGLLKALPLPKPGTAAGASSSGGIKGALAGAGAGFVIGRFGGPIGMLGGSLIGGGLGAFYGGADWLLENPPAVAHMLPNAPGWGQAGLAGLPGVTPGRTGYRERAALAKIADKVEITINTPSTNPAEHAQMVLDELTTKFVQAQTHNLDEGAGSHASPFTGGAPY